ncbi:MAG: HD domain-containing protein [Clostridia bacterium]|nr:HD domain-containing protein [Clostridia bacterium]
MEKTIHTEEKKQWMVYLILCIAGVLINYVAAQLADSFRWPVYLDCIGTVLAAALGGMIPGVIVGFLTNLFNSIFDSVAAYYSFISVLLALAAAILSERGWLRRFPHVLLSIVIFALIGGGLGSILTWFMNGANMGEDISSPLVLKLYQSGQMSPFLSQLTADLLIDLLDKAITTGIVVLVCTLLPATLRERFRFDLFSDREAERVRTRRFSLRTEVLVMISVIVVFITAVVTSISLSLYRSTLIDEEGKMAWGVARTAASNLDADKVDAYITEGRANPDYGNVSAAFRNIAGSSLDISYVYAYRILEDGCHVVVDPDTDEGPGTDPGVVIPFDQAFLPYVPGLLKGEQVGPIISDERYGWLLTVYYPVMDSQGRYQCHIGVDISMQRLRVSEMKFLTRVLSMFLGFFTLIIVLSMAVADAGLVRPINAIVRAARVDAADPATHEKVLARLRNLDITTGDEIETLYEAITESTGKIVTYAEDVEKKNRKIARLQNGLVITLAEMVESRDKCTGNHIKNTASYVRIIMEKMLELGMYPGVMSREYIEEVVGAAPLHDIGKIHIPDHILNKPGKLLDDEYEMMKTHSSIGGDIIEHMMDMVNDDTGYLKEAHNLTMSHHERWDGKGYPSHLAGEHIPLSARIMAVADVFDALVSRRSYKPGFPFEKAVDIIREGAGTQFDPQVVKVFLMCLDKVRKVSEEATVRNEWEY